MSSSPTGPTSTTGSSTSWRSRPDPPHGGSPSSPAARSRNPGRRGRAHDWPIDVHPLPPLLHNRPHLIADEVRRLATSLRRSIRGVAVATRTAAPTAPSTRCVRSWGCGGCRPALLRPVRGRGGAGGPARGGAGYLPADRLPGGPSSALSSASWGSTAGRTCATTTSRHYTRVVWLAQEPDAAPAHARAAGRRPARAAADRRPDRHTPPRCGRGRAAARPARSLDWVARVHASLLRAHCYANCATKESHVWTSDRHHRSRCGRRGTRGRVVRARLDRHHRRGSGRRAGHRWIHVARTRPCLPGQQFQGDDQPGPLHRREVRRAPAPGAVVLPPGRRSRGGHLTRTARRTPSQTRLGHGLGRRSPASSTPTSASRSTPFSTATAYWADCSSPPTAWRRRSGRSRHSSRPPAVAACACCPVTRSSTSGPRTARSSASSPTGATSRPTWSSAAPASGAPRWPRWLACGSRSCPSPISSRGPGRCPS